MAHWIKPKQEGYTIYGSGYAECSNCNTKVYLPDYYQFCPFCGKKIENVINPKKSNFNWNKITEGLPAE